MTINDLKPGHRYRIRGDGEVYVHKVQTSSVTIEFVDAESVATLKEHGQSRKAKFYKDNHTADVFELVY